MPESIIVDDGGSTRIRWAKAGNVGELEDLTQVLVLPGKGKGSQHEINKQFAQVLINYRDENGVPDPEKVAPRSFNNRVLISSLQDQYVLLERTGSNNKLTITVYSTGSEPLVEYRQAKGKRWYMVLNSGAISTVSVDDVPVYNSGAAGVQTQPVFNGPALSTSVTVIAP